MCTVGGAALPDGIAMEDDPAYYKHNKHIKQCAPHAHQTRSPTSLSTTPEPRLVLRLVLAPRTFAPHRASPSLTEPHLPPRLTCHHRASPGTASPGTAPHLALAPGTAPRVAPRSNHDVEDIYRHWDALVDANDLPALTAIVTDLVAETPRTERGLEQALIRDHPNPNPNPNLTLRIPLTRRSSAITLTLTLTLT
jgi:hypothetical protein